MTEKRKDQLESELSTNFADNNTGAITPQIYRDYMTNVMDSYSIRTAADTTYYVSSTGSDSNTGLGSGDDEAMLTMQAALAKVPKNIDHDIVISVAAGTFDGFTVIGYWLGADATDEGSLTIQGTLGSPTLGGGTSIGTATSGGTTDVTDTGQAWVSNELTGMLCLVDSEYRVVKSNTSTKISLASAYSAGTSGKAYAVLEPKTVFNTLDGHSASSVVYMAACITGASDRLTVQNIDIQAPASAATGFYANNSGGFTFTNAQVSCASAGGYGVLLKNISSGYVLTELYVEDSFTEAGIGLLYNSGRNGTFRAFVDAVTGHGMLVQASEAIEAIDVSAISCGGSGLRVKDCQYVGVNRFFLQLCGADGMRASNSRIEIFSATAALGNTGHGVNLLRRVTLDFVNGQTVSGTVGDISIGGVTKDWSDDWSADGDQVIDANLGIIAKRDDSL